jgi:hypothetical protein
MDFKVLDRFVIGQEGCWHQFDVKIVRHAHEHRCNVRFAMSGIQRISIGGSYKLELAFCRRTLARAGRRA